MKKSLQKFGKIGEKIGEKVSGKIGGKICGKISGKFGGKISGKKSVEKQSCKMSGILGIYPCKNVCTTPRWLIRWVMDGAPLHEIMLL